MFVSRPLGKFIVKPTPSLPSHAELDSESGSSDQTSVGARGVAFSLGDDEVEDDTASQISAMTGDDEESEDDDSHDDEKKATEDEMAGESSDVDESFHVENHDGAHIVEDDDELGSLLGSLHSESSHSERQIGVVGDRDHLLTLPKCKRILSNPSLPSLALTTSVETVSIDLPKKRMRSNTEVESELAMTRLRSVTLGPPEESHRSPGASIAMLMDDRKTPISPSENEEELDDQLREELDGPSSKESRESTPVPLLTPPRSPVAFEWEGQKTTLCEWPSNLVVDSAMAAVISERRPPSPDDFSDS